MVAARKSLGPTDQLTALASALEAVDLRSPEFDRASVENRERLVRIIRSYLVPRLDGSRDPLIVVFAGPTGSGKSTIVNSLSGHLVSRTGPLRPTTTGPVVLAGEQFARKYGDIGQVPCEVIAGRAPILDEMVLVDTPDIDSTETGHRAMAEVLMDNADAVVFVTSALRYADLVPWEVLRRAISRGTPLIQVLNRVTPDAGGALSDFKRRLIEAGLSDDVIRVPEHHIASGAHAVPSLAVAGLRRRLFALAGDRDRYRQEVAGRVLNSTLDQVRALVTEIDSAAAVREIDDARIEDVFSAPPDLGPLNPRFGVSAPPQSWPFRRLRWLRRNRVDADALRFFTEDMRAKIRARVETDIGLRARSVPLLQGIAPDLARNAASVIESAVDGWIGRVPEQVASLPERDRGLAAMILLSGALGVADARALTPMFWPDADPTVDLASDLMARLEVPYSHAVRAGAERVASLHGYPASANLLGRLTETLVTAQLADA